jgi:hypothetical protein
MTIIIRLDLDRHDVSVVERLVIDCVITIAEAMEHSVVKRMTDYERLMWMRELQRRRHDESLKVG